MGAKVSWTRNAVTCFLNIHIEEGLLPLMHFSLLKPFDFSFLLFLRLFKAVCTDARRFSIFLLHLDSVQVSVLA